MAQRWCGRKAVHLGFLRSTRLNLERKTAAVQAVIYLIFNRDTGLATLADHPAPKQCLTRVLAVDTQRTERRLVGVDVIADSRREARINERGYDPRGPGSSTWDRKKIEEGSLVERVLPLGRVGNYQIRPLLPRCIPKPTLLAKWQQIVALYRG